MIDKDPKFVVSASNVTDLVLTGCLFKVVLWNVVQMVRN